MSSRAMTWAWMQGIKPGPKFVLIALADRADELGLCYPGMKWIGAKTGFSERAIRDNLQKLINDDYLLVERRKRADGSSSSNLYTLKIPMDFALSKRQMKVTQSAPPPAESAWCPVESAGHNTPNYTLNYKREDILSEFDNPTPPEGNSNDASPGSTSVRKIPTQSGFDAFWTFYPKRIGKLQAKKQWKKLKPPPAMVETILAAIRDQITWRENANGAFRPEWKNPATWLNAGSWEDEVELPTEPPRRRVLAIVEDNGNGKVKLEDGTLMRKDLYETRFGVKP